MDWREASPFRRPRPLSSRAKRDDSAYLYRRQVGTPTRLGGQNGHPAAPIRLADDERRQENRLRTGECGESDLTEETLGAEGIAARARAGEP